MTTIKLTQENLHALSGSPGKNGFTRKQVEMLGFTWPPVKGWLTSLIGKEIDEELYRNISCATHKKWAAREKGVLPDKLTIVLEKKSGHPQVWLATTPEWKACASAETPNGATDKLIHAVIHLIDWAEGKGRIEDEKKRPMKKIRCSKPKCRRVAVGQLLGINPICRQCADEYNRKKRARSAERRQEGLYSPSIIARMSEETKRQKLRPQW